MSEAQPELSEEIVLDDLPRGGRQFTIEANDAERDAVAGRLGVVAVEKLSGTLRVTVTRDRFSVRGTVVARLKRECVVSLEEFVEEIDEAFELDFVRRAETPAPDEDELSLDSPEVHEDAKLDIGELLVQQLSLAMDPFPRKPGVRSLAADFGKDQDVSPFASALAKAVKTEENQ